MSDFAILAIEQWMGYQPVHRSKSFWPFLRKTVVRYCECYWANCGSLTSFWKRLKLLVIKHQQLLFYL